MDCQVSKCEINHMEMIEIEIEKTSRAIHGKWPSLTLEMGCRYRLKVRSGVTMLRVTLHTLD